MRASVGAITESDVLLASASNAIIIGFNVRPERKAQELAEQEKVDIRLHSIIYEVQDEIKKAMTGLLEPIVKETYLGRAEVRDTFRVPKVGTVAGCYVQDGVVKRDSEVRLLRDNVVVFKGKISSVRRFKEDVNEVRNGMECGISIANYNDIKVGDVFEVFVTEKVAAEAFRLKTVVSGRLSVVSSAADGLIGWSVHANADGQAVRFAGVLVRFPRPVHGRKNKGQWVWTLCVIAVCLTAEGAYAFGVWLYSRHRRPLHQDKPSGA